MYQLYSLLKFEEKTPVGEKNTTAPCEGEMRNGQVSGLEGEYLTLDLSVV